MMSILGAMYYKLIFFFLCTTKCNMTASKFSNRAEDKYCYRLSDLYKKAFKCF